MNLRPIRISILPTLAGSAFLALTALTACSGPTGETGEPSQKSQAISHDVVLQAEWFAAQRGIQLEGTSDAGGGQNVGWIDAGDWLEYNHYIPATQVYRVSYRVASQHAGGRIRIEGRGGQGVFGTIQVPVTGQWQSWTTVSHEITLPQGSEGIRLVAEQGGFNINWFRIESVDSAPEAPGSSFEAEDFAATSSLAPLEFGDEAGRTYLSWPGHGGILSAPSDRADGQLHYRIVAEESSVSLFATVNMQHAGDDSFYYKLEGVTGWIKQNDTQTSGFQEIPVSTFEGLNVGQTYVLRILRREDGAKLDSFRVVGASVDPSDEAFACGNGVVEPMEQCDDGNLTSGDGCDDRCRFDSSNIVEAERADEGSPLAPFEVRTENGVTFLEWPGNGAALWSPSDSAEGQAHYAFTPSEQSVNLFATVDMEHAGSDSFYYQVEGVTGWIKQNGTQTSGFQEISVGAIDSLTPGQTYKLKILRREDGAKLDRFRIDGGVFGEGAVTSGCGDGVVDDTEECDDGNRVSGAACSNECTFNTTAQVSPSVAATPGGLRRILGRQYVRGVEMMFGDHVANFAEPPADPTLGGAEVLAAFELGMTPGAVERFERSALGVAETAVLLGEADRFAPCLTAGPFAQADRDSCYSELAENFGLLAFRRPLRDVELTSLSAMAVAAESAAGELSMPNHCAVLAGAEQSDCRALASGAKFLIATVLQSPSFLYSVELGVERGGPNRELDPYSLLTRMSLVLTGHLPNSEQLAFAAAGGLGSEAGIRQFASELLEDDLARHGLRDHLDEIFELDLLKTKGRDPNAYPNFDEELKASMEEEAHLFIDEIVFDNPRSFLEVFRSESRFVDARLAEDVYGIAPPAPGTWQLTDFSVPGLSSQQRTGILTMPAILTVGAHPNLNSPTRRGLSILSNLLCFPIPPPPVEADVVLPTPGELTTTLREHLEDVHAVGSCNGCHDIMDPIGFGFENYDAIGAYRTEDNGFPVDASGLLLGGAAFDGARELSHAIADHDRLPGCLAGQFYRNSVGQSPTSQQQSQVDSLVQVFANSDHSMPEFLIELASSPGFREVSDPR